MWTKEDGRHDHLPINQYNAKRVKRNEYTDLINYSSTSVTQPPLKTLHNLPNPLLIFKSAPITLQNLHPVRTLKALLSMRTKHLIDHLPRAQDHLAGNISSRVDHPVEPVHRVLRREDQREYVEQGRAL